jgi:hypothetical protein
MELDAAVEYHDYYAQSVDRALGQPRGYGDLRMNHVNEIARLRGKVTLTCRDCGAEGPLIAGLCAGCSDASEAEDDTANARPHAEARSADSVQADVRQGGAT